MNSVNITSSFVNKKEREDGDWIRLLEYGWFHPNGHMCFQSSDFSRNIAFTFLWKECKAICFEFLRHCKVGFDCHQHTYFGESLVITIYVIVARTSFNKTSFLTWMLLQWMRAWLLLSFFLSSSDVLHVSFGWPVSGNDRVWWSLSGSCVTFWSRKLASLATMTSACGLTNPVKETVNMGHWMSWCIMCGVKSWDGATFRTLSPIGSFALPIYIAFGTACSTMWHSSVQVPVSAFSRVSLNKWWTFLFTV